MNKIMRETAELTLVYAVPVVTNASDKSRLCGLQRKLQKHAKESLDVLPLLNSVDKLQTISCMDEWGVVAGWSNNAVHVGILVSFCAEMLERSKQFNYDPNIYETIVDIVDHLIKGDDFKDEYITEGARTAELWLALRGDIDMPTLDYAAKMEITVKHINDFIRAAKDLETFDLVEADIDILESLVDYLREKLPVSDEEVELIRQQEACAAKLKQFNKIKNERFKIGV